MKTETLKQMREWLADCAWGDMDPEDFVEITDSMVLRGVERFYCGGVEQFMKDGSSCK